MYYNPQYYYNFNKIMSFEGISQEIGERHDESPQEKKDRKIVDALSKKFKRRYAWMDSCPRNDEVESLIKKRETLREVAGV